MIHAVVPTAEATRIDLERRTQQLGRELLEGVRRHSHGPLSSSFWSEQLVQWALADPAVKVQLFRFVDVFPVLRTAAQVHDYLLDYLGQPGLQLPLGMGMALKAGRLAKGMVRGTVARQIRAMGENFIAGEDAASALPVLAGLWRREMAFSVDLLGEACVSDVEAQAYQQRYVDLVEYLPGPVSGWAENPTLEADHMGQRVPRVNVSIKISALTARTDPLDFSGTLDALQAALRPILEAAARNRVTINFDMEQAALKDLTLKLFERSCEEIDFPAGIALQSYLRSGPEDAARLIAWAKGFGRQVSVRLIKGAYWDYEVIHAEQTGWPIPVWTTKEETDACFERMAEQFVATAPRRTGEGGIHLAVGSHNLRSIARVLALVEQQELPPSAVEFQMLFGMADAVKQAVVDHGLRLRQYVPIGQMIPGMAYLVRRLLENTSNQSWLRAGLHDQRPDDELLAAPRASDPDGRARVLGEHPAITATMATTDRHNLSPAVEGLGNGRPFSNEPLRDFSQADQREAFAKAIAGATVTAVGKPAEDPHEVAAVVARASKAFPAWADRDAKARAAVVVAAAEILRRRRDELAGIVIRESGKTWREADADICEAIDFCEFYARWAVELLAPQRLGAFVGELNHQWRQPRGVAVVISPWNFPLAICTGMTAAALVTGNSVIVKPSTQTPAIAWEMCHALWSAGTPPDVLQFLPGPGSTTGSALVRDPRVALIAFTGSSEVGLDILRAAGETADGQPHVKKVVCEMGGKNAIVIDDSADLDEAVLGVRQSAFSYSGQKCSACSRVIVLDGVFELFLSRLIAATQSLVMGDPLDPGTDIGPVIDRHAAEKILRYIEIGKQEGRLELACEPPPGLSARIGKPVIGPHIFSGILPRHRLAREEIFGPVLSVMRASSFDEAIELANASDFKLTGGVYSRKPSHLEAARHRFRVGNLYLNRGITGALVGRQPFGGFGRSGTGTKAGGEEYLLHFLEPRACCENTMRHGFAPGLG